MVHDSGTQVHNVLIRTHERRGSCSWMFPPTWSQNQTVVAKVPHQCFGFPKITPFHQCSLIALTQSGNYLLQSYLKVVKISNCNRICHHRVVVAFFHWTWCKQNGYPIRIQPPRWEKSSSASTQTPNQLELHVEALSNPFDDGRH